jgi:outer membrane protein, adhesin transport system
MLQAAADYIIAGTKFQGRILMGKIRTSLVAAAVAAALLGTSLPALAASMKDAVARAVKSNPEITEAIASREAVEFELEQGRGLLRPRVDLESRLGGQIRSNRSTRAAGDDDHLFLRKEASIVVRQTLFDGSASRAEIEHQAARVDSASLRIRERSEFIALAVIREFVETNRLTKMIGLAKENISANKRILGEIAQVSTGGALSVADRQQAQERVYAAEARLIEFQEELKASNAAFIRLVGSPIGGASQFIDIRGRLPKSLAAALNAAHNNHPTLQYAVADIDAAAAMVKGAQAKYAPKLSLEGRATAGDDLNGINGSDYDLQGNLVLNWNLFNGGIDSANTQEQIRHVDEAYSRLNKLRREVDEGVRQSWDRRYEQQRRLSALLKQLSADNQLAATYKEQFSVGERSLLDLLDTENTRFEVKVAIATSTAAVKFAEYRLLASTGTLLRSIGLSPNAAAKPFARDAENVPETPTRDSFKRVPPPVPKG